jgi:hypothetical protein
MTSVEKDVITFEDIFQEVYTCDVCLKYFPEELLDRCDQCGEIFCIKCVQDKISKKCDKYKSAKHYFCSQTCCEEHILCLPNQCNIHHAARTTMCPHPFLDAWAVTDQWGLSSVTQPDES